MQRLGFALCAAIFLSGCLPARASGPTLGPIAGAATWLNGSASAADLRGKVVLIDVFTVDCYNCRNVVATLRDLYAKDRSRGLAIVGIHSPETPVERRRSYVIASLRAQGIVWPVAVHNAFALWNAYGVQAWPTQLVFDRHGRLRDTIVGDSQDERVRADVERLLQER